MLPTLTDWFSTRLVEAIDTDQIQFPGSIKDSQFTASAKAMETWIAASRHELQLNCSIAIPTEMVYRLAANALNSEAVGTIFSTKGRPSDNPLIVHMSSVRMLQSLY
ncbi:hypothetical protein GGI24_005064, partial [Coemansia furcata]